MASSRAGGCSRPGSAATCGTGRTGSRGHSSGALTPHVPFGAWYPAPPPEAEREVVPLEAPIEVLVRSQIAFVDQSLRVRSPCGLGAALQEGCGVRYLRTVSRLRRSSSLPAAQRFELETRLATKLVQARAMLSDWKGAWDGDPSWPQHDASHLSIAPGQGGDSAAASAPSRSAVGGARHDLVRWRDETVQSLGRLTSANPPDLLALQRAVNSWPFLDAPECLAAARNILRAAGVHPGAAAAAATSCQRSGADKAGAKAAASAKPGRAPRRDPAAKSPPSRGRRGSGQRPHSAGGRARAASQGVAARPDDASGARAAAHPEVGAACKQSRARSTATSGREGRSDAARSREVQRSMPSPDVPHAGKSGPEPCQPSPARDLETAGSGRASPPAADKPAAVEPERTETRHGPASSPTSRPAADEPERIETRHAQPAAKPGGNLAVPPAEASYTESGFESCFEGSDRGSTKAALTTKAAGNADPLFEASCAESAFESSHGSPQANREVAAASPSRDRTAPPGGKGQRARPTDADDNRGTAQHGAETHEQQSTTEYSQFTDENQGPAGQQQSLAEYSQFAEESQGEGAKRGAAGEQEQRPAQLPGVGLPGLIGSHGSAAIGKDFVNASGSYTFEEEERGGDGDGDFEDDPGEQDGRETAVAAPGQERRAAESDELAAPAPNGSQGDASNEDHAAPARESFTFEEEEDGDHIDGRGEFEDDSGEHENHDVVAAADGQEQTATESDESNAPAPPGRQGDGSNDGHAAQAKESYTFDEEDDGGLIDGRGEFEDESGGQERHDAVAAADGQERHSTESGELNEPAPLGSQGDGSNDSHAAQAKESYTFDEEDDGGGHTDGRGEFEGGPGDQEHDAVTAADGQEQSATASSDSKEHGIQGDVSNDSHAAHARESDAFEEEEDGDRSDGRGDPEDASGEPESYDVASAADGQAPAESSELREPAPADGARSGAASSASEAVAAKRPHAPEDEGPGCDNDGDDGGNDDFEAESEDPDSHSAADEADEQERSAARSLDAADPVGVHADNGSDHEAAEAREEEERGGGGDDGSSKDFDDDWEEQGSQDRSAETHASKESDMAGGGSKGTAKADAPHTPEDDHGDGDGSDVFEDDDSDGQESQADHPQSSGEGHGAEANRDVAAKQHSTAEYSGSDDGFEEDSDDDGGSAAGARDGARRTGATETANEARGDADAASAADSKESYSFEDFDGED